MSSTMYPGGVVGCGGGAGGNANASIIGVTGTSTLSSITVLNPNTIVPPLANHRWHAPSTSFGRTLPNYHSCNPSTSTEFILEYGARFDGSGALFMTSLDIDACYFHYLVWRHLHPEIEDYGVILVPGNHEALHSASIFRQVLAFRSTESLNLYLDWQERYMSWYPGGLAAARLAPLRPGLMQACQVLEWPTLTLTDEVERWAWITSTCTSPVQVAAGLAFFTCPDDAVHYKLRW